MSRDVLHAVGLGVRVLGHGPGVCTTCHGPAPFGTSRCYCCTTVASAIGSLAPVAPISLCRVPGPLYTVLRGYKDAPVAEARTRFAALVGLLLESFLNGHACCLEGQAGGPLDLAVAVPPTRRPGVPPLHQVPAIPLHPGVLIRGPGPLGHLQANTDGFAVADTAPHQVAGRRILLVDDLYTTGARAQSAAVALTRSGATSVVIVVVGRTVRPEGSRSHARYWDAATAASYDPAWCCQPDCQGPPP